MKKSETVKMPAKSFSEKKKIWIFNKIINTMPVPNEKLSCNPSCPRQKKIYKQNVIYKLDKNQLIRTDQKMIEILELGVKFPKKVIAKISRKLKLVIKRKKVRKNTKHIYTNIQKNKPKNYEIKNSLFEMKSKLNTVERNISELEDVIISTIQIEAHKEKMAVKN